MKEKYKFIGGLVLVCSMVFLGNANSQQATSSTETFSSANVSLESATDEQIMLQAVESVTPVPFANIPVKQRAGTFWSAQHPPDSRSAWPPLPGNIFNLPVWPLGDGQYILDDRQVDYVAIQTAIEAEAALTATPKTRTSMSMMASSLASSYAYGNPVYLTNLVVSAGDSPPITASFSIGGGTNFVPYDILMTTNVALPVGSWNWLGIGYTSNRYTFANQPADLGFYMLAKPTKTMTVAWGGDVYDQSDVPAGITNAVMVAGSYQHSLALLNDGTVAAWGNSYIYGAIPTNLTGASMVAAGWDHSVILQTNGTVTAWGIDYNGILDVPMNLSNAIVVSAQGLHSLALTTNGAVMAWGDDSGFGETSVPAGLTNVTAIAAGGWFNLAVSNGYVVPWGYNGNGQCNVPAGLSNVWDVAAGWAHSVALKKDGTVVCWGDNSDGECTVPAGLSNVVAIAAGGYISPLTGYTMAVTKGGGLVVWGDQKLSAPPGGLNNVVAVAGGTFHAMAIRTGPATPVITLEPTNQYQIVGGSVTFSAKGQGLYGVTYQWQTNGVNLAGATNATLTLTNVQAAQAGVYDAGITDNAGMGSIASSNANFYLVTPPVIISQAPMPTNQVAAYQTNLTLSIIATAPGQYNGFPLHYQWQFNGTNLPGATTTNYSLFVDTPSLGAYSVVVTSAAGSVTSLVWQVTMTYAGSYIAPGTLAYHLSTNAVAHTNGITDIYNGTTILSDWNYSYYSGTNMALLTNAIWSTNFWLKGVHGVSATCIGFTNGLGGQGLVTMVSPRHCLYASHMHLSPGRFMAAFLDTNNVVYWRTNMENVSIGNDTSVGILDADLPPSVGFLPIIPTNFSSYLPTNSASYVQGIGMNQDMRLFSQPMILGNPNIIWSSGNTAPFGLGTNWNTHIRGGDSSDPEVLLIGNQLVLVSHNYGEDTNNWTGTGPNYAFQLDAINQNMHYLSTNNGAVTDYQLTSFSLTNWPTIH